MEYEEWMIGRGLRPRTVEQRVDFALWRLREWGTWDMAPVALGRWLGTYSGWTAVTYHSHLSSIYNWLTQTQQLASNPMTDVRRPRTPKPKPKPLSPLEVERALEGVTGHLRTWMLLALLAGLRVHEVAKFDGRDIDAATIYIVGKGGQAASVPTHPELWNVAKDYPRRGMWFPSPVREGQHYSADHISGEIADRFRAVGIEKGSIHRLRATYGTNLVRQGANIRIVQTLMRHSSLATTEHYLGVDEDERAAAIKMLAA